MLPLLFHSLWLGGGGRSLGCFISVSGLFLVRVGFLVSVGVFWWWWVGLLFRGRVGVLYRVFAGGVVPIFELFSRLFC
ncbi:hypothetical protein [Streptomyces collinus]|uniref:hypothetical protein n=1 Tax=Streptomyces collinus TaxID=42684 RepID=UPI0036365B74